MTQALTPFPTLLDEPQEAWQWPALPFEWPHLPVPDADVPQPCSLEMTANSAVRGYLRSVDVKAGTIKFSTTADGPALTLPFTRFVRITLNLPLKAVPRGMGAWEERVPVATYRRHFELLSAKSVVLEGYTVGSIERPEGLFLFTCVDDERALLRSFVPRCAYRECKLGPTAQGLASQQWIGTREDLLEAIDRQRSKPVLPIGHALLDLGLVTQDQIDRTLKQFGDAPLGERLVEQGVISRADLETAIAHKMGYPLVDLARFPIEQEAIRKIPLKVAAAHRTLPIMVHGKRLIVAVDKPARVVKLRSLFALGGWDIVPVLASKRQLILAMTSATHQDPWSENVSIQGEFFAETRT